MTLRLSKEFDRITNPAITSLKKDESPRIFDVGDSLSMGIVAIG